MLERPARLALPLLLFGLVAAIDICKADEGLWLFDRIPHTRLQQQHRVKLRSQWLDHLRLSTVHLSNSNFAGGRFTAAAFVSPNGLIATSHFVLKQCLTQVQRPGEDLLRNAFYAPELQDERRCPGLEANVLISIEDVTNRVRSAAEKKANVDSRAAISQASAAEEQACTTPDVRCNVVSLYAGALLHLYRYQVFRDVRLVFAPEDRVAFYGGEEANFNFPRWAMTIAFLRVWNGERLAETPHHFRWSASGPRQDELVFQAADAWTTDRARPVSFLEVDRDVSFPAINLLYRELRRSLEALRNTGDNTLEVQLASIRNSAKAQGGRIAALQNADLIRRKKKEEQRMDWLLLASRPSGRALSVSRADVDNAAKRYRAIARDYWLLEFVSPSRLLSAARWVVRWSEESTKPDPERLPEFRGPRVSLQQKRFSDIGPIDKARETALLTAHLRTLREALGVSHPICKQLFATESPEAVAEAAINGSALADRKVRNEWLHRPDIAAVKSDPLIRIAAILDEYARRARTIQEEAESTQAQYTVSLAEKQLQDQTETTYPEATGTLRLTWGKASGFGKVPYATRLGEWFSHPRTESRDLPGHFEQARVALDHDATLTFISTVDVANGHAGPTVDLQGNLVGMLFDSNYAHIGNAYLYLEAGSRAVHMSTAGALELLKKVYQTTRIVDELDIATPAAQKPRN